MSASAFCLRRRGARAGIGNSMTGHKRRLVFIRRSRQLGFSLDEIRNLLGLARGHELSCAEVKTLTEQHVARSAAR